MIISAAPIALPVSTANPPTEAVASETAQKVPIPKSAPATENPNTRNSTENHEQPKNSLDFDRVIQEEKGQQEQPKDEQKQSPDEKAEKREAELKSTQEQNQENKVVEQLKQIDREVRAHETAHASVGGNLAGSPQLNFETGPDGRRYAVSGEVSIDTGKVPNNPQATIDKMSQVRQAALAPATPSPQDLKVAAIASQIANQALVELNIERNQELHLQSKKDGSETGDENDSTRGIRFASPIAAKRSSLQLSQKIIDTGALDDIEQKPLLSQTA